LVERIHHCASHPFWQVPLRLTCQVTYINRIAAPLALDEWRIETLRNSLPVEGRRHHQQAQIIAQPRLGIETEGQCQIAMKMALMKFVEDHQSHPVEGRILLQAARQDSFGNHLDAGLLRHLVLKADPVADALAGRLTQLIGHARRGGTRRQAAWFQNDDGAARQPGRIEQCQRDAGGLARPRRGLQNHS
jgi:hypothetical protein